MLFILHWLLLRVFRINDAYIKPTNWRVARSEEPLSSLLGFQPAVVDAEKNVEKLGFNIVVYIAGGKTRYTPLINFEARPIHNTPHGYMPPGQGQIYSVPNIADYTLFNYYFRVEPCVLYGRVKTFFLVIYLKILNNRKLSKLKYEYL